MNERFGKYLKRDSTIDELEESSEEEDEEEEEEESKDEFSIWRKSASPKKVELKQQTDEEWEKQQVLFLQSQLQRARTPSVESVKSIKKEEDEMDLNLTQLHTETADPESPSKTIIKTSSQDDFEVIDGFMKEMQVEEVVA